MHPRPGGHVLLIGRGADGEWRTAAKRACPDGLCALLGAAVLDGLALQGGGGLPADKGREEVITAAFPPELSVVATLSIPTRGEGGGGDSDWRDLDSASLRRARALDDARALLGADPLTAIKTVVVAFPSVPSGQDALLAFEPSFDAERAAKKAVTEGKVGMLLAMIKADRHLLGRVERAVRGVAGKVTNHVILTKTHPVMVNALSLLYSRVLCNQDFPADLTDSLLEQVVTEFTAFLADTILVEDCSGAVFDYVQPISLERVERASADGSERHPCPDCGRQSRVASGLG